MATQKKCPECGKWTNWNHQLTDKCEHCGELFIDTTEKQRKWYQKDWVQTTFFVASILAVALIGIFAAHHSPIFGRVVKAFSIVFTYVVLTGVVGQFTAQSLSLLIKSNLGRLIFLGAYCIASSVVFNYIIGGLIK